MKSLYEDLRQGLEEAIEYEKGKGAAKAVTYVIEPVKRYTNEEIRSIRNDAHMTQTVFADYMGVSNKTVEAWECGRIHPSGPACRLMYILALGEALDLSFISKVEIKREQVGGGAKARFRRSEK